MQVRNHHHNNNGRLILQRPSTTVLHLRCSSFSRRSHSSTVNKFRKKARKDKDTASPHFRNSFQTTIGKQSEVKRPISEQASTPPAHSITLDPSSATILGERQRKQCRAEIQHNVMFTTKPRAVIRFASVLLERCKSFSPRRTAICNEFSKSRTELHGS